MKYLMTLLLIGSALAQPPAGNGPAAASPQKAAPAAESSAPAAPAAQTADSGAAASDSWLTGSVDFGYRFRTGLAGNAPSYQSIVNLREGMRLFGIDFTLRDPKKRVFDRLNARGYNWGDPYNTAHVDAAKSGWYDFRFDYRNILYYNAVPSFANPAAPFGFSQQSLDVRNRNWTAALDLRPNRSVVPYFVMDHNARSGNGVTSLVDGSVDSFPVPTSFRDRMNNYRGGLRFEFRNYHVTLEEGGSTFEDNESVFTSTPNAGNFTRPVLGQDITLSSLLEAYGIRAHNVYSKALLTANPYRWVNIYGQFLYSQPKTEVNYQQAATGNLVLLSSLLFYSGNLDGVTGAANKPHISGNLGGEIRPLKSVRIVESWSTDRFHDSAYASLASVFITSPTTQTAATTPLTGYESVNYNRNQTDIFWDPISKVTLRGGYRYEWGDARLPASLLSQTGTQETGKLSRQVAIAGIHVRPIQRLTLNGTFEGSSTSRAYFRTSLYNYNRVRAQARYQISATLSAQTSFNDLQNHNPLAGVLYQFESRDSSASLTWAPKGGKRFSVLGEYDREIVNSSISYLDLPFLTKATSVYNVAAHMATGAVDVTLPAILGKAGKLSAGGSLAITNGTRSSRYYQPFGRLSVPFGKHIAWNTQWQWYGFSEQLYGYEAFRKHLIQTGIRLTR
jgi:hypothetical protein